MKDLPMKDAVFVNLDVDGLEKFKFEPFECVYGALKQKYGFEQDYLLNVSQDCVDVRDSIRRKIASSSSIVNKNTLDKGIDDDEVVDEVIIANKLKLTDVAANMILHLAKNMTSAFTL